MKLDQHKKPCDLFPDENWEFTIDSIEWWDVFFDQNPRCDSCLFPEDCREKFRKRIAKLSGIPIEYIENESH